MSANPLTLPQKLVRTVFGSRNERFLKKLSKKLSAINAEISMEMAMVRENWR